MSDDSGREERFEAMRNRLDNIEKKAIKKSNVSKLKEANEEVCSFCGKGKSEVEKLLQAKSGATICSDCIQTYMKNIGD